MCLVVRISLTVRNKTGLHARPASQLVMLAKKFESDMKIIDGETEVNPKSIISILSAGINKGTTIDLIAEGADEQQAADQISEYINMLTE